MVKNCPENVCIEPAFSTVESLQSEVVLKVESTMNSHKVIF